MPKPGDIVDVLFSIDSPNVVMSGVAMEHDGEYWIVFVISVNDEIYEGQLNRKFRVTEPRLVVTHPSRNDWSFSGAIDRCGSVKWKHTKGNVVRWYDSPDEFSSYMGEDQFRDDYASLNEAMLDVEGIGPPECTLKIPRLRIAEHLLREWAEAEDPSPGDAVEAFRVAIVRSAAQAELAMRLEQEMRNV